VADKVSDFVIVGPIEQLGRDESGFGLRAYDGAFSGLSDPVESDCGSTILFYCIFSTRTWFGSQENAPARPQSTPSSLNHIRREFKVVPASRATRSTSG
jgi:hypothetical protein